MIALVLESCLLTLLSAAGTLLGRLPGDVFPASGGQAESWLNAMSKL